VALITYSKVFFIRRSPQQFWFCQKQWNEVFKYSNALVVLKMLLSIAVKKIITVQPLLKLCCFWLKKMSSYVRGDLGSISPTYLRKAFTGVALKSIRIQSSCLYLFTLLGSTRAKAEHRMLIKLTPGVNFINSLWADFYTSKFTLILLAHVVEC